MGKAWTSSWHSGEESKHSRARSHERKDPLREGRPRSPMMRNALNFK
jgi:hypothetical protein